MSGESNRFIELVLVQTKTVAMISSTGKMVLFFSLLFLHLALSLYHKDFTWLSSCGGLMTIFGIILIFHYSLPENEIREYKPKERVKQYGDRYQLEPDSGFATLIPEQLALELIAEERRCAQEHAQYLGEKRRHLVVYLLLTIIGTFVWAYASYLNLVYARACT